MIDKTEILELASVFRLRADIVEKDYVLGWLLATISNHPALRGKWIFKGGTCLKKCYFETYRFSEDLDFTLRDPRHLDEQFLRPVFEEVSSMLYDRTGIEIPSQTTSFDIFTNLRGKKAAQGRVGYLGPLGIRGSVPRIKLDLTDDEALVLEPEARSIYHPYSDDPPEGLEAYCYSFIELFAEKTRALAERARPRDLYDVIHLFRRQELVTNKQLLVSTLRQKCVFKGISVPTFADIEGHTKRAELETEWENMLKHQLEELPSLEQFWRELPTFFLWLHEDLPLVALPTYHSGTSENIWRPGRITGRSSANVQRIQFAAANRVCIRLRYSDEVRLVEPYSFRTSRDGAQLFYGFHREARQMKCFRIDKFQSVEVTGEPFSPRYQIEISSIGRVEMPPVSLRAEESIGPQTRKSLRPARSVGSVRAVRSVRAARPRRVKTVRSLGTVSYTVECMVCKKRFKRSSYDTKLNPHKGKNGFQCPGSVGRMVR